MKTFFTSDTHFSHRSIMRYEPTRPQGTPEQMNAAMIAAWNAVVTNRDEVWHLGDVSFGKLDVLAELNFAVLNILKGNHDETKRLEKYAQQFSDRREGERARGKVIRIHPSFMERRFNAQYVVLCHYALRVWNRHHHGAYMLYGHSHGHLPPYGKSCDVGWDSPHVLGHAANRPLAWEEIDAWMQARTIEKPDHHGVDDLDR